MTIKKQSKAVKNLIFEINQILADSEVKTGVKNILNSFLSHYLIKYDLYNGFNYYNKNLKLSPAGEIVQFYYN